MSYLSWTQENYKKKIQKLVKHEISTTNILYPVNQSKTGYCWLYASLNVFRHHFVQDYQVDNNFQFSHTYLMFWDKYERAKYFLENYKNLSDEIQTFVLKEPISDSGQWNIFEKLIEKYGIVPDVCYPHTYSSKDTFSLNLILNHKLRYAILHNLNKDAVLNDIYTILEHHFGKMHQKFTWMYRLNNKTHTIANIHPYTFYLCYVLPTIEHFPHYISLIHDPRNEYYKYYESNLLTSSLVHYNIPMDELTNYAKDALLLNYPVFCTCDINKYCFSDQHECFVSDIDDSMMIMDKKERLIMYDSFPNHAMVLHGFTHDTNWKMENSWGRSYYYAEHDWVNNFLFQIVIPKHIVKKLPRQKKIKRYSLKDPFGRIRKLI